MADTAEVLNLNVTKAPGQDITISDYETVTITTSGTATSLEFTGVSTTDVTLNGSTTLALATATLAKSIDASAYTGAITHTTDVSELPKVTYGTGADSVTLVTAEAMTVDGGGGNDGGGGLFCRHVRTPATSQLPGVRLCARARCVSSCRPGVTQTSTEVGHPAL